MAATRHGYKQGNGTLSHWYMGSIGSTKQVLLTYQSYNEPAASPYPMSQEEAVVWNKNAYESPRLSLDLATVSAIALH